MGEAARVLEYDQYYTHRNTVSIGAAAPAIDLDSDTKPMPARAPQAQEQVRRREKERAAAAAQRTPVVSIPAVLGALIITILFIFVVLAQIQYNEIASETVRLTEQITRLTEQRRSLEIAFESIIDMKEVERFARDELGMSRPEKEQIIIIRRTRTDRAEVIADPETGTIQRFGEFISSLMGYIKR